MDRYKIHFLAMLSGPTVQLYARINSFRHGDMASTMICQPMYAEELTRPAMEHLGWYRYTRLHNVRQSERPI